MANDSQNLQLQKLVKAKQQQWADDEDLWMGRLPGDNDREIMFSLKLGLPIMDIF